MAAAGYRPSDYRLVTMGYASPFPPGGWIRYPEDGWSRLNEGGCPVWNADADWAAGAGVGSIVAAMRRGRRCGRRRVPRPPPRSRRPPALRPPLAPGRPGGPVADERRVGPPPRLRPGLQPRVAAPQRLRPARDRRLHRPPLRRPARRLLLLGDARPRLRRRDGHHARRLRRGRHQLDPVAAGGDGVGARGAPVLAAVAGSRSRARAGARACRRSRGRPRRGGRAAAPSGCSSCIRWIWVPSRSSQVKPAASAGGGSTCSKPSRAKNSTARSTSAGRDLDADVVEHQNASESRAATITIAVDQVTASATIWLSRP